MEAAILSCYDGSIDFDRFASETLRYWQTTAHDLLRRWDHPPSVDSDDLVQEMLFEAWKALRRVDPAKGSPVTYVKYAAIMTAKRWLHRQRCVPFHSRSSNTPHDASSKFPIGTDLSLIDRVASPAVSIAGLTSHEAALTLLESMKTEQHNRDRAIIESLFRAANIDLSQHSVSRVDKFGKQEAVMSKSTIRLEKVNPGVMKQFLTDMGLSGEGTTAELAKRLHLAFQARIDKGELTDPFVVQCDVCDGFSDVRSDRCPYCGAIEDPPAKPAAKKPSVAPPAKPAAKKPSVAPPAELAAKKPSVALPAKPTAKKPSVASPAKPVGRKLAGVPSIGSSATPTAKQTAKKTISKRTSAKRPSIRPSAAIPATPVPASEDSISETNISKYTEHDLDRAVTKLNKLAMSAMIDLYEYGTELCRVDDAQLWKLRKGGPYKTFEQFCRDELSMSRQHAYRLMAVTRNYTKPQLEKYGLTKLHLALQVPEEMRMQLLGDGTTGKREMSEQARELAGKETRSRTTPTIDNTAAVTIAIVPGIIEVPMQKRPTAADWPTGKLTQPAKALSDDPWCRMPLTNNVFLTIRLTRNDKGEIIAIIEHRRGEEKA